MEGPSSSFSPSCCVRPWRSTLPSGPTCGRAKTTPAGRKTSRQTAHRRERRTRTPRPRLLRARARPPDRETRRPHGFDLAGESLRSTERACSRDARFTPAQVQSAVKECVSVSRLTRGRRCRGREGRGRQAGSFPRGSSMARSNRAETSTRMMRTLELQIGGEARWPDWRRPWPSCPRR